MATTFASLLAKLTEGGVRHLVVGGVAVCLHGYLRATRDLDVIIEATPENARRLIDVLSQWGGGAARDLSVVDFYPAEVGAVRIGEDFVLDVFTLMRSGPNRTLDYATLANDARHHSLENGLTIQFASAEQLIEMKTGTGRLTDEADIAALRGIQTGAIPRSTITAENLRPAADDQPTGG